MKSSKNVLGILVSMLIVCGVSACSKDKGAEKPQDGADIVVVSAETMSDYSLRIVADRIMPSGEVERVEYFVSPEADGDVSTLLERSVGKKVRVKLSESFIIAVLQRDEMTANSGSSESKMSTPPSTDADGASTDAIQEGQTLSLLEPAGEWVLYKKLEKSDLYFEKIEDGAAPTKTRRFLEFSDKAPFGYPIYLREQRAGSSALADAIMTTYEINCAERTRNLARQTFYLGLLNTLRQIESYRANDPIFEFNAVFSGYKLRFGSYMATKGDDDIWRDFFLTACTGLSFEMLPDAPPPSGPPIFGQSNQ
jgi:hypothetical protein